MKAYHTYEGQIRIGTTDFNHISPSCWRKNCGVVLQDGYIFNDTIARNICVNDENIDMPRLIQCCKIANITSYIESLPNGINTQLGADGTGLSQGQRQRILIARAIYKRPDYLFLDEATNALDANNEKLIVKNLSEVFFFVFSDDMDWCRKNLKDLPDLFFVGEEYYDNKFQYYLQLMVACKHFIVSNSSFAWWAAWLCPSTEKIVFAPKRWFTTNTLDTRDLLPESWITL